MSYTVQELARYYAEVLVRFHELSMHCEGSVIPEDHRLLTETRNDLFTAQDRLNAACRRQAELNLIA